MDKQSNSYTFIYASVLVIVVAAVLAFVSQALKPIQDKNEEIAKKIDILKSVGIESTAADAEAIFEKHIGVNAYILDVEGAKVGGIAFDVDLSKEVKKDKTERKFPVYQCKLDNGEEKFILPVRGKGLWGPIWGYIALSADKNTVFGATFGHKGETPGLGAEIEKPEFQLPFKGKTLFDKDGKFLSISVVKGGGTDANEHAVDAISGGTITSKGLEEMLLECLSGYENFLKN